MYKVRVYKFDQMILEEEFDNFEEACEYQDNKRWEFPEEQYILQIVTNKNGQKELDF
jgi:hypothetical protein